MTTRPDADIVPDRSGIARSIRGPLRYRIGTSSPQLEAGTPFSLSVHITNPYDVPATILSVGARMPVDFRDMIVEEQRKQRDQITKRIQKATRRGLFEPA